MPQPRSKKAWFGYAQIRDLRERETKREKVNSIQQWSHTMTKQQTNRYANKQTRIKRARIKADLILLVDEVGLTEILKD